MTLSQSILSLLAAAGGGAAVAFALMRAFAAKWLESLFLARAEGLKHEHSKEIERIKLESQQRFDRFQALKRLEFEALPKIWLGFSEAGAAIYSAIVRFRMHTDLDSLNDEQLLTWLDATDLPPLMKKEISSAPRGDRNNLYSRADDQNLRYKAKKAAVEATNCLAGYSIFFPDEILSPLEDHAQLLWKAAVDAGFLDQTQDTELDKRPYYRFLEDRDQLEKDLRVLIRARLLA